MTVLWQQFFNKVVKMASYVFKCFSWKVSFSFFLFYTNTAFGAMNLEIYAGKLTTGYQNCILFLKWKLMRKTVLLKNVFLNFCFDLAGKYLQVIGDTFWQVR